MLQKFLLYLPISLALLLSLYTDLLPIPRISTLEEPTSLAGEWKIKIDDKKEYSKPEYDDNRWDTWNLPGTVTPYISKINPDSFDTIYWLRKTVYIGKSLENIDILGLILGKIASADETYFNGIYIGKTGSFPPEEFSMWNHPRHYLIPKNVIRFGENNVISIRVHGYIFSEVFGTLAIADHDDWLFNKSIYNFFTITINYIIIFMATPLIMMFIIIYIRRREEEYLYYCLQLFCGFFIIIDVCTSWNIYPGTLVRLKILLFSWVALNIVHPIFLHRLYQLKRKKIEITLWSFLIPVTIFLLYIQGQSTERTPALIFISISVCFGLYNISCHLSALRKRRPYAKLFSLFGITVIVAAIHDGIGYLTKFLEDGITVFGYSFDRMVFGYGAAALYIGTALVLIYRFMTTLEKIGTLNYELESKINIRTDELKAANEELEAMNDCLTAVNDDLENTHRTQSIDMRMAGNVQAGFLPKEAPQTDRYDIAFFFKPLAEVSGDFYDFYINGTTLKGLGLFDVSGHGISSGLITLISRSIIFRKFMSMPDLNLGKIMEEINNELIAEIGNIDNFLTGILLRFSNGNIEYANSGHPDPLYRNKETGEVSLLLNNESESIRSGFMGISGWEQSFKTLGLQLNSGDSLLLYTDGFIEVGNEAGEQYGVSGIKESLKNAPPGSAQETLDFIIGQFHRFAEYNTNIDDDLTAILIKKK